MGYPKFGEWEEDASHEEKKESSTVTEVSEVRPSSKKRKLSRKISDASIASSKKEALKIAEDQATEITDTTMEYSGCNLRIRELNSIVRNMKKLDRSIGIGKPKQKWPGLKMQRNIQVF